METFSSNSQMDGGRLMRAVMALSGGMDSTGLLVRLLADGYKVSCISYDYGQKHVVEIERAKANISYLAQNGYEVEHRIADLSSAMSLFHSALTSDEIDIPEGHYEEEQMKATVVPNRNAIFSSILYGYALSVALREDCDVSIALLSVGKLSIVAYRRHACRSLAEWVRSTSKRVFPFGGCGDGS